MMVGHVDNLMPLLDELGGDLDEDVDKLVKGEVRRLKVDRLDGSWVEKERVLPSDVGQPDLD
jgi:hypothetical protein